MNGGFARFSPEAKGKTRLWQVFWVYGVAISQVLLGAVLWGYPRLSTPVFALLLLGFVIYTVWIMRLVWINADNTDTPLYGDMARYLTVAWAMNALLFSGFLLLSHLAGDPLFLLT